MENFAMAKMIISGTWGTSDPARASMPFHIGKGARQTGYEVEPRSRRKRMHRPIQRIAISVLMLVPICASTRVAAQTKSAPNQPKCLYDRLRRPNPLPTVDEPFFDPLLLNAPRKTN